MEGTTVGRKMSAQPSGGGANAVATSIGAVEMRSVLSPACAVEQIEHA
jgi:hypothetical protein